jgi:hypothetical protein
MASLDDYELELGKTYALDVFFAERLETGSNLRMETTYPLELLQCLTEVEIAMGGRVIFTHPCIFN